MENLCSDLLALSGRYAPTILYGRQFVGRQASRSQEERRYRTRSRHYNLIAVHRGIHLLDLADGQRLRVDQGSCYLIPPGPHCWITPSQRGDASQLSFTLLAQDLHLAGPSLVQTDKAVVQPQPQAVWGMDLPVVLAAELAGRIGHDLRTICALWWRDPHGHIVGNTMLTSLLTAIATFYWEQDAPLADDADDGSEGSLILRALRLFTADMADIPDVGEWASRLERSRAHFTRRFHREVGQAPGTWMRATRIQEAERLLCTGVDDPTWVAERCGFSSADALRRAFKHHHGLSWQQWTRRHRR